VQDASTTHVRRVHLRRLRPQDASRWEACRLARLRRRPGDARRLDVVRRQVRILTSTGTAL